MLRPGGQLFFHAFGKTVLDEAYTMLDRGKWAKYNNRKSISPFFESEDPKQEYEKVIESVGFVDSHVFAEDYVPRFTKKSFEGRMLLITPFRSSIQCTIKTMTL